MKLGFKIIFYTVIVFSNFFISAEQAEACQLVTGKFRGSSQTNAAGGASWYDDENPPYVYIDVQTSGCVGKEVISYVKSFTEVDTVFSGSALTEALNEDSSIVGVPNTNTWMPVVSSSSWEGSQVSVPEQYTLTYQAGEEPGCDDELGSDPNLDCNFFIHFAYRDGTTNPACEQSLGGEFHEGKCYHHLKFEGLIGDIDDVDDYGDSDSNFLKEIQQEVLLELLPIGSPYVIATNGDLQSEALTAYLATTNPGLAFSSWLAGFFLEDSWDIEAKLSKLSYNKDGVASADHGGVEILPYGGIHANDTSTSGNAFDSNYDTSYDMLAPLPFEGLNTSNGTPDVGQYVAGIFQLLIIIAGVGAIIMIIIGGIQWMTSDVIGSKSEGKKKVTDSIFGLALVLGSWAILNTFNQDLVGDMSLIIPTAQLTAGDTEIFSSSPSGGVDSTSTAFSLPTNLGLYCPGSGGSGAIAQIVDSFDNKVTYRYGGKGGPLPAGTKYPRSPGEVESGQDYAWCDGGPTSVCRQFCPEGTTCLDCSGFVNHVWQCAGESYGSFSGTSGMVSLASAVDISGSQINSAGTMVGDYTLQPGDLLVWNGHVVMYYGDGKIVESRGSKNGWKKNNNIVKSNLGSSVYKNKIDKLIKINN